MIKLTMKNLTSDANGHLFLFVGDDCIQKREEAKQFLSRKLAECKRSLPETAVISSEMDTANVAAKRMSVEEIKTRASLLAKDKVLFRLHKDLVMSKLMTEDEFWENRGSLILSQEYQQKQQKGVSSSMITQVRPTLSSSNDVKYTLTPAIIESIFFQFPNSKFIFYSSKEILFRKCATEAIGKRLLDNVLSIKVFFER